MSSSTKIKASLLHNDIQPVRTFVIYLSPLFFNCKFPTLLSFPWAGYIINPMSDYLKKPKLQQQIEYIKGKGFALTSCSMQGWRKSMEDSHLHVQLEKDVHLFAVFDGHGGPEVAHYASAMLPKELLNEPYFKLRNYHRAFHNVFRRIDQLIISHRGEQDLKKINQELPIPNASSHQVIGHRAGTTAVVLLMTKQKYYVANIGDSRAVLARGGTAVPLSADHKPDLPSQHNRIQKAGGFVSEGRVNGTLSLSRSFGDFQYKTSEQHSYDQQCVTCVPEITETDRDQADNFIIMGCDGVWQRYVSNSQKMVTLISQLLQKHENSKAAMQKLFGQLVAKDSKDSCGFDNMTALLLEFQ